MKKTFLIVVLPAFILLQGCVKILNDDLGAKETKLVLNAALVPDSVLEVNLSRTFNIFEDESANNLPFINGATVKLMENGNYLFDLENIGAGYYKKDGFYPKEGMTYEITAEKEGYKSISATTTVPAKVDILKFDTVTELYSDGSGYSFSMLNGLLTFNEPQPEGDFYMISAQIRYPGDTNIMSSWTDLDLWPPQGLEKLYEDSYGKLLWSDKYGNGKEVTLQFGFYGVVYYYLGDSSNSDTIRLRLFLQHITRDYFNYAVSYNKFQDYGSGDPFTEPVVIYSNITNGYGIFGSYSQDTVNFSIPFVIEGKKGGNR